MESKENRILAEYAALLTEQLDEIEAFNQRGAKAQGRRIRTRNGLIVTKGKELRKAMLEAL